MLAAAFALTTECHAKICRAEEISRSRQRHQEMLVDQLSRIPRIFQSFLQRRMLAITQLLVSSLAHLQFIGQYQLPSWMLCHPLRHDWKTSNVFAHNVIRKATKGFKQRRSDPRLVLVFGTNH